MVIINNQIIDWWVYQWLQKRICVFMRNYGQLWLWWGDGEMTKTTDPRRRYQLLFATTIYNSGRVNDVQETSNNVGRLSWRLLKWAISRVPFLECIWDFSSRMRLCSLQWRKMHEVVINLLNFGIHIVVVMVLDFIEERTFNKGISNWFFSDHLGTKGSFWDAWS